MEYAGKFTTVSSRGHYLNTGSGPTIQVINIGHSVYSALIDPDTAFWALIKKDKVAESLTDGSFLRQYREKITALSAEMNALRFGLKPSAVYLNPTDRCNLNCNYCYIPETIRKSGMQMSKPKLLEALDILKSYFRETLPDGMLPQIVFHGAEPMLNREAIFAGIEEYSSDFSFGVQTNGTLMDEEAIEFLTSREIGIGLSLDGHISKIADSTRRTWAGDGVFKKVVNVLERLKGYPNYNVICTVTSENMQTLPEIVEFFHALEISICMLNPVRCTQQGGRNLKPIDHELATYYLKALNRTYELYQGATR